MKNLKTIHLQIREILKSLDQKNPEPYFYLTAWKGQKTGIKERQELRRALIEQLKNHVEGISQVRDFNWSGLLRIETKPFCPFAEISISHCQNLGAFVFVFGKRLSIGFDMEKKNRITGKIMQRLSSKKEREAAPSLSLLWTAKEAGLKCFSSKTQLLLKDIHVFNGIVKKKLWFFDLGLKNSSKKGRGVAGFVDDLAVAYAKRNRLGA